MVAANDSKVITVHLGSLTCHTAPYKETPQGKSRKVETKRSSPSYVHSASVEVVSDLKEEKVVTGAKPAVAERITPVCGHLRVRLIDQTRCQVPVRMPTGEPVCGDGNLVVDRMLYPELSSGPDGFGGEDVLTGDKTAGGQPRLSKGLAYCGVTITADVIATVSHRDQNVRSRVEGNILLLILIEPPFNGRYEGRLILAGLDVSGHIHTDLNIVAGSNNKPRHKTRKTSKVVCLIDLERGVELNVDLATIEDIGCRNIKNGLLTINDGQRKKKSEEKVYGS